MGHADLLKLLLPPVAYDRTGIVLSAEIAAEGAQLDAFSDFVGSLLDEVDPRTTTMLEAWERVYGLPEICGGPGDGASVEERRTYLLRKIAATASLSRSYFLNLASELGYEDTTVERLPLVTCESTCEALVRDDPRWRFAWRVNLPHEGDNYTVFCADSACTDPIDYYAMGQLECVFMRLKPAHTYVLFSYEELA